MGLQQSFTSQNLKSQLPIYYNNQIASELLKTRVNNFETRLYAVVHKPKNHKYLMFGESKLFYLDEGLDR